MINHIVLVGRTTKQIELKENKNGTKYAPFILAVNRPYQDEQADFINCVAWNKTAETMAKYVLKGMMIGVEGRLQVRSYENEAGVRQYISEVLVNRFTFLESKKSESVEPYKPQSSPAKHTISNPFDANFSNPNPPQGKVSENINYSNPFITATTLAGSLNSISSHDDDLPF